MLEYIYNLILSYLIVRFILSLVFVISYTIRRYLTPPLSLEELEEKHYNELKLIELKYKLREEKISKLNLLNKILIGVLDRIYCIDLFIDICFKSLFYKIENLIMKIYYKYIRV